MTDKISLPDIGSMTDSGGRYIFTGVNSPQVKRNFAREGQLHTFAKDKIVGDAHQLQSQNTSEAIIEVRNVCVFVNV